jgi:hypothetical protein
MPAGGSRGAEDFDSRAEAFGAYGSAMDFFFEFLEFLAFLHRRRWPLLLVILGPTIVCLLSIWYFGHWWY